MGVRAPLWYLKHRSHRKFENVSSSITLPHPFVVIPGPGDRACMLGVGRDSSITRFYCWYWAQPLTHLWVLPCETPPSFAPARLCIWGSPCPIKSFRYIQVKHGPGSSFSFYETLVILICCSLVSCQAQLNVVAFTHVHKNYGAASMEFFLTLAS